MSDDKVGSIMVIGAGIGGMQSAQVIADSGFKVYLVEGTPSIGGRMTQLDKTFPTNECSMCTITPVLVGVGRNQDIVKMTTSTIKEVRGRPGNFEVDVLHKARYVDMDKCTGCGDCAQACPVKVIDTFNMEMGQRKAVYIPFPQAVPLKFAIDRREASPCKVTCPANLSAQGYVALIAEGRYKEALEVVKDVMPFAGSIGRVCNHLCEGQCKRDDYEGSVSIRTLKRFIADWERESGEEIKPSMLAEPNGRKVAIVGGGCAGLTCAYHLARLGYSPTVFEAQPVAGGMLRLGIPDYRLPGEVLQAEIDDIARLGVEIKTNIRAGKDFQVKDLMEKDGFEAVFLAVGLHRSMRLGVPGEDAEGVMHGVEFLRAAALKENIELGQKIVVIGGGNVAVDVARTARRLGATDVHMVCLEKREEMPAHSWEIEESEEEGIEVHCSWGPLKILTENGKVTGIELKSCTCVFDGAGKFCPEYDENVTQKLEADNVLVAIGQGADIQFLEGYVETGRGINIKPDQSTNVPGVFAGGDITYGPKMAIDAINSGRLAAWEIDRYLNNGNNSAVPPLIEREDIFNADYYKPKEVAEIPRHKNALLEPMERVNDFREIEIGYTEEEAKEEASRCLSCGVCARCGMCEIACQPKAIFYRDENSVETLNVGAIVVAAGFDIFESTLKSEYGYGTYRNVISALQYERVMAPTGPSQGHIFRPSDHATPKKVAWLQCVGSRDLQAGNEYCSAVCCTYATKEAIITREDIPDSECTIFFMDMRTFGKGFEEFYNRAKEEYGVKYVRARVAHVEEVENNNLLVTYRDEDGTPRQEVFDLVVLSSGLRPRADFMDVVEKLGIDLNEYGFVKTGTFTPMETNKPGIFVSGAVQEPKDIPDTVAQSIGVAAKATSIIHEKRGTELAVFEYPPEIDLSGDPRIGVFVCHCGVNIGSVVDVPTVAEYAKKLPNVVYAENNLFTCSQDTQEKMKELIKEHNLNRVVVASCTPRTHEPLFQETLRGAGVNPYLFDLVSIREHCSWVHREVPAIATEKAKRVISMAVEKVARNMPVHKPPVEITRTVLIIGGGIAGMNAALDVVSQDFDAYLVEKEPELGGNMRNIPHLLTSEDPQAYLKELIEKVESHPKIHVYKSSRLADLSGFIGNFEATIGEIGASANPGGNSEQVKIGAIVVAVGAQEFKPEGLFKYGEDPRIMTQIEFDRAMMEGTLGDDIKKVVMIQCVGSREGTDGERPYCSRVCCSTAVKNALRFTDGHPEREVLTLYRDIRTYGYKEKFYREARGRGMIFTRYLQEEPPVVSIKDGKLNVEFKDLIVNRKFTTQPDLVVLSAATVPFTKENIELAQMLKVPLTLNNFFLEAHTKIAPVDFAADGIFLAGTCHGPKFSDEAIFQASAAAAKAMSVISRDSINTEGIPSMVDDARCVGCGLCEANCAYNAITVNPDRGKAEVNEILCKGCGACQAVCPSSVPYNRQFGMNQIMRMIETATEES